MVTTHLNRFPMLVFSFRLLLQKLGLFLLVLVPILLRRFQLSVISLGLLGDRLLLSLELFRVHD